MAERQASPREDAQAVPASLDAELLQMIAEQAQVVPRRMFTSAVFIAVMLLAYIPPALPLAWLAAVGALIVLRTRMLALLPADTSRTADRKLTTAAWVFTVSAAGQVSVLGFFPFVPVAIGSVLTIYCVGLCSATLPVTAGYRRIFLPYLLVAMGPIAVIWPFAPGFEATLIERGVFVALTVTYMVTMLGHARGIYNVFADSYHVRSQRAQLNLQLSDALGKAEAANRAKTRFLASASHDLRQPIHALALFSGSLHLRKLDQSTATIAEQIDKAVKALAAELDALLDVSRLDAGVIEQSISDVDLGVLLQQLSDEFAPLIQNKGLQFSLACPQGTVIRTDSMLFQRIVRNLLSNALKYTDAGWVSVAAERRADRCRITISDTGTGIAQSEHGRIFEEFYQVQNPERDRSKGLGLGLSIVSRLTNLLGIDLQLDSAIGQGSSFSLSVAMADPGARPAAEPATVPQVVSRSIDVLVVDDEETIRLGMKTLLEEMGFGVRVVASTEEATAAARQQPPSVMLADFRLRRDDDGMRAISAVREICPALPALLISGDTAPDRLRQAHAAGVELLHKPVSASVLRSSILSVLES